MSYKIKFFLSLCIIGTVKSSDFGASCSSDEFQDPESRSDKAIITGMVIRSAESTSPNEKMDISLKVHQVEQEIHTFQRNLRRKFSGLQSEYEDLTKNPKFLTSEKYVETKVGSFVNKVLEDEQNDQKKFNELSEKVSTLRGSFCTKLSERKELLSEENPVDSLIGSLRVLARDHGFRENPLLQVPSLKLNGFQALFKSEQESEGASGLSIACNLGSGIRRVESTVDNKNTILCSKKVEVTKSRFTLQQDFIDHNCSNESSDLEIDNEVMATEDILGDNCPGITRKESSNYDIVLFKTKKPNFKNMNDDDSDYE